MHWTPLEICRLYHLYHEHRSAGDACRAAEANAGAGFISPVTSPQEPGGLSSSSSQEAACRVPLWKAGEVVGLHTSRSVMQTQTNIAFMAF